MLRLKTENNYKSYQQSKYFLKNKRKQIIRKKKRLKRDTETA